MYKRDRGFALILVIWSLVILLGLSAGFAMAVRHETRVANDIVEMTRIDATAIAARNLALLAINQRKRDLRWRPDGQPRTLQHDGFSIAVRVRSDTGRIDLNEAPSDMLVGLIEQLAPDRDAQALADALVDWRDRDDRRSTDGAEGDDYRNAGLNYRPPNRPFSSTNELGQILGFDSALAQALSPYVTVHSQRPLVNALSAGAIVLAAIPDVDMPTAQQFVLARDRAMRDGSPPPVDMLGDGRQFVDMQIDIGTLLIDIAIFPNDRPMHLEQVVLGMNEAQQYALLSRETLQAADAETWWQP